MVSKIEILDSRRENCDFAKIRMSIDDIDQSALLDIDFRRIYKRFGIPNKKILDFLLISSIVYSLDRLIPRKCFDDNWTRNIEVEIPVFKKRKWSSISGKLNEMLCYLTGDIWEVSFRKAKRSIHRPPENQPDLDEKNKFADSDSKISLFSGGLDSLIGAIDLLEKNKKPIQLIGHYDGTISGVKEHQIKLYNQVDSLYPKRTNLKQLKVGLVKGSVSNNNIEYEVSTRSRSIVFMALGVYAAEAVGPNTNLYIPENGFISINIPISPSRRGACSTRTTHPNVLNSVNEILSELNISQKILNPYSSMTKGEMIQKSNNKKNLKSLYESSISCSKHNHREHWENTQAKQCGVCLPCIIRRSSCRLTRKLTV